MSHPETRLCDSEGVATLIADMASRIAKGRRTDVPLRLVGIRTRGFPLAIRLAEALERIVGVSIPVGAVEITLYRDDLDKGERWPVLRGTDISFDVDGVEIVLVDDVLFSGRTVRAALNAICDLGRPAHVRLAVMVDRGHRELPIQPDVVGLSLETRLNESVAVRIRPIDAADEIVRMTTTNSSESIPGVG